MAIAIYSKPKRGQSMVEVVVALTILAFVLAGTTLLIVTVVNLSLQARTKTKVVTFAQSNLARIVSLATGGCLISDVAETAPVKYVDDPSITSVSKLESLGREIGGLSNFKKATVTVTWDDKRGNYPTYTLSQLLRTEGD